MEAEYGYRISQLVFIEKESEDLIDLIDKGILTTNQAYLQVSREKKERESRLGKRGRRKTVNQDNYLFYQKSSDNMEEVEDEFRGRVMSVFMMNFGLMPLGVLPAGAIAEAMGGQFAVGVLAALLLVFTIALWATQKQLRNHM